jgi:hypothetical protein
MKRLNPKLKILKTLYPLIAFLFLILNATAQNPQVNGYKGIWFTLGQPSAYGDKYSGGLGTYTANHLPVAVYAAQVNKTFFVYGGTTRQEEKHLLIMISYFDHRRSRVPKPAIAYDKRGVDDPHDNASLAIDDKGFLWVFVSGRNTSRPGIILKSNKPYNIESFQTIKEGEMTYPQPWWMKNQGFFYLFTKYTNGRELYWSTSSDGTTWTADKKLAGMGGHYQLSHAANGRIFSVFNYHPNGNVDKRTNIYLLQTDDMGASWKTIDGTTIPVPLTDPNGHALVMDFERENKLVYLNDLTTDEDGNPVILAVISRHYQPGPQGDPREWMIFHWKNGKWNMHKVCTSTHNYDMGSLYIEKNRWIIIGPTEKGPQAYGTGGEMALWESRDEGKRWIRKHMLTQNSSYNHTYARRPLYAHQDFYALWADGHTDSLSASRLYFSNKKGRVWMLPYDMDNNFAKPVRIGK